jgi:archaellum component FlaC
MSAVEMLKGIDDELEEMRERLRVISDDIHRCRLNVGMIAAYMQRATAHMEELEKALKK